MDVRATSETLHATHNGQTFYFCSDACRDRFTKDPAQYPARAKTDKR
jgi:YHS domain-containing protein